MRKITIFLISLLSISVFFSCNFQIPAAVEVSGNPELKFSAKKDIGDTFENMVPKAKDGDDNEYEIIKCIKTETRTYILRSILLEDNYKLSDNIPQHVPDFDIPLVNDEIIGERDLTIAVNFDSVLSGFILKPVAARVYIYGDSENQKLIDALAVKIKVESENEEHDDYNKEYTQIIKYSSGINGNLTNQNECSFTSLPGDSAADIILPLGKDEIKIDFSVYVPKGKIINPSWFVGEIYTEILVWVPLEFVAGDETENNTAGGDDDDDNDGITKITIPRGTLFPEGKDLFGRSEPGDDNPVSEFIESLELLIMLNINPFEGRDLIIWSGPSYKKNNIIIEGNKLKGKAFNFLISEEKMAEINNPDNYPFEPNFRIEYEPGEEIKIPWDIRSTEFVFKAKVNYRKEF